MSDKTAIKTALAPAAIGPYSQAIATGQMVFTAGQIGIDPATGSMVTGGILPETTQVLTNLRAVLAAAGCSLDDIVKTTELLADMSDFGTMNGVYEAHFSEPFPARSAFEAAALPKGARVEIEAVAVRPGLGIEETAID